MTNSPYVRSAIAHMALGLVPPMIRNSLLEEPDFRGEYGIEAEAILSFGESGVSIPRFELFEAIREILAGASAKEVTDANDENWKVEEVSEDGGLPVIELSRGAQRLNLPGYAVLSPDTATRLRSLDESASDVNLPSGDRAAWRDVLAERPLDDDEVDEFHNDLRDTPIERARSIHREMIAGHSSIHSLVPLSRAVTMKGSRAHMTGAPPFLSMQLEAAESSWTSCSHGDRMMASCTSSTCHRIIQ